MSALAVWIVTVSPHVTDAAGHEAGRPIPLAGAEAIAAVCEKRPDDLSRATCAAVFVVMCFRESGYKLDAVGDGGRAKGPWQVHTSIAPKTWKEAVEQYAPILVRSATTCKEPLAMLASGSCTNKAGIEISKARMAASRALVATHPFKPEDPS